MTRCFRQLLAVLATLCLCVTAWAQSTSRVTGTVQDKTGALIPGATVTLTNEATNVSVHTVTTSTGTYTFDGIVPGTYTVTVEQAGFATVSSTGNILTIAQPMVFNATLQVSSVSEKVVVTAGAELVQTDTSGDLGALIDQQALTTLPIVGARGRSPLDLLELTPGVVDGGPMNSSGANIQGGGVTVDGSRDRAWNYTLDGIDITENSAPGSNFSPLRTNPDSISGFRVINTNADAAYGQTSGAQVILNTRSGTNQFHGDGYWSYQTPGLNANDPGNKENGLPRPQFIQNILGFDVGGPIFKNKTFFFVNVQGLHTQQSFSETSLVYTQNARNGLIRYIVNPANCGTTGNPPCPQNEPAGTSGAVVDTNGNPLAGLNIGSYDIAANDPEKLGLDPSIQKFLGLTPLPNNFAVGDGLNTAGFTWLAPEQERQIDFTVRIDHQFNEKNSIFGRWAHGHQNTIADIVNGGLQPFPSAPPVVDTFRQPRNLAVGWRYTPSSSLTNQVIVGMNRFIFNFANPDANFASNAPFIFEGDAVSGALDGLASPRQNYVGNLRALTTIQLVDNLTYIRGQHAFKFGTNLHYERHIDNRGSIGNFDASPLLFFDPIVRPPGSTYNLPNDINPGNDLLTLTAGINNLLGRISEIQQGLVAANANQYAPAGAHLSDDFRMPEYDFYGQDSWKIRPNLTIDLGLRWEIRLSPRVGNNFLLHPNQPVAFNAAPSDTLTWTNGPLYKDAWKDFGPSIGFAWDPFKDGKSSVRANYRLAYDSVNSFVLSSAVFQGIPGETFQADDRSFGNTGGRVSQGIPTLTSGGITPAAERTPPAFSTNGITIVDPHWTPPQVSQWSLSLQRQVGKNAVAELSYIGHHAVHLFGAYDANQAQINSNGFLTAFNAVAAGGDSPLIDQLLSNDPTRPSGETGSQWMRDSNSAYSPALGRGSVAEDALIIGQATDSSGVPLPVSAGLPSSFFFLYPQFAGAFDVLDSRDWSWYHGLQATYRGHYEALTYQFNYTYSKSEDTRSFDPTFARVVGGGSTFGSSSTPFDNANPRFNYAPSDFDRTHVFQGIWTYKIPFGADRKWASSWGPMLDRLVGGWEVSGDTVIESGRPTTFYSPANTTSSIVQTPANCSGCSPFLHVHRVSIGGNQTILTYFPSKAQFSTPAPGAFSNVGRNFFRLPGYSVFNLSLGKVTRIRESQSLEVRVEMQNAFNSVHYEQPASGHYNSSAFGVVDFSTVENFGLAPGSSPRTIQLTAKYNF